MWKAHGDPTEVALIVSALRGGLNEEKERLEYPILDILPFESELRYMATLNAHDRKVYLLVKGAPEKLGFHVTPRSPRQAYAKREAA
ncbi:MAG: hypothetical protein K6T85_12310 [Gorillibacterium sp.]|nr:hypothetical protein [Gorillibacterium sp.]